MAWQKKTIRFENVWEITEYHSAKYGAPGMERMKRKKATPEMIEKINQHNRERTCRWKLLNNFRPGDYFTLLTYRKEKRPADMIQAKKDFEKFYKKVGKE